MVSVVLLTLVYLFTAFVSVHGETQAEQLLKNIDLGVYWQNKGSYPETGPEFNPKPTNPSMPEVKVPIPTNWVLPPNNLKYPFLATIHTNDEWKAYYGGCVIMNPQYCITLASIVHSSPMSEHQENLFQIHAFDDSLHDLKYLVYNISKIFFHPKFKVNLFGYNNENDLAVIRVDPLFRYFVFGFISLLPIHINPADNYFYIIGHSQDNDKHNKEGIFSELRVKLIDKVQCEKLQEHANITGTTLCSKPPCNVASPCFDDLGVGLYKTINYAAIGINVPQSFHLVFGLVADVYDCYVAGPTVYTYLLPYNAWVYENTQMDANWWEKDH